MIDVSNLTIQKAHDMLVKKEITVRELAQTYLDIISEKNPQINAYLEIYDDVMEQADEAQKIIDAGNATILTGIPIALKDNILIKSKHSSAGSKILEQYVGTYDSTVVTKLKAQHVVFLGRVNMDEFAMGSSTETSAYGTTKNPHDTSRVPGGSSGGSAASVAMNGALVALGSDTGGSIRQPAALCGVVGLKPTYGSVSRHGLMAMGSSLDVIGPITKNVSDAQIIFDAIKGKDIFDSTSIDVETKKVSPKKIGVPFSFVNQGGIDADILSNFNKSIDSLKSLGYEIIDISLPNIGYSLAVYYVIMPAEVSSNMARFDGVKFGNKIEGKDLLEDYTKTRAQLLGKEVRKRILLGTYVLSAGYADDYYKKALAVKELIAQDFKKAFTEVDVILTPASPSPAFKFGEKSNDPIAMYLEDIFTVTANLVGIPGIAIPSGFVEREDKKLLKLLKLPIGIQFMAAHGNEDVLFEIGKKFEGTVL